MKSLLTVSDVSKILNISEKTVRRWIKAGKLTYIKMGSEIRFKPEHLEEWIEARTIKSRHKGCHP
jgi:excisionase family DNA binding protein